MALYTEACELVESGGDRDRIISRGCIGKDRIGSMEELRERTKAWSRRMNARKVKIDWKFTTEKARKKFKYKVKTILSED